MCCTASQTIKIISILQSGREVSSSEIVRRARDYLWSWPDINFHLYCPIPESFTAKKSCFLFFLEDWGYLAVTKYLSILKCRSLYIGSIYHGAVKLVTKLVNFLKGENLLNFWHSFVTGLKVLVFKKQSLYFMMIFAILAWIFITKNAFDHNENTNKQVLLSKIWYKRSQSSNDPGCRHTYKESSEEGGQYFPRHGDRYGKR